MGYTDNRSSGQKAAETRQANTRREVEFIAGAYWDCAQFVFNSGFRDIGIVNGQFDNMLGNYVTAGKIKRESYTRFHELALGVDVTKYDKISYVTVIQKAFDDSVKAGVNADSPMLYKEFQNLLNKYGMSLGEAKERILFLQLMDSIADATSNRVISDIVEDKKRAWGLKGVTFNSPKVKTSDGDGCSHGITYGSVFRNMDKINKNW